MTFVKTSVLLVSSLSRRGASWIAILPQFKMSDINIMWSSKCPSLFVMRHKSIIIQGMWLAMDLARTKTVCESLENKCIGGKFVDRRNSWNRHAQQIIDIDAYAPTKHFV